MKRVYERGDTIVEVVIAFAIFAIAAIGTIVVINNGLATTQRNLEISLVRQQIDSQGEMIRFLRDANNATWQELIDAGNLVSSPYELSASCQEASSIAGSKTFFVVPTFDGDIEATTFERVAVTSSNLTDPATYAKINYADSPVQSEGIWIQVAQAQTTTTNPVEAYDFYIHACWDSVGTNVPMTLGTIVRVYG